MTKIKSLTLGVALASWSIGFMLMQSWLLSLLTALLAICFIWLFVAKFRRDRRFAALSGFQRVTPHTRELDTPTPDNRTLFVSAPSQPRDERR